MSGSISALNSSFGGTGESAHCKRSILTPDVSIRLGQWSNRLRISCESEAQGHWNMDAFEQGLVKRKQSDQNLSGPVKHVVWLLQIGYTITQQSPEHTDQHN